MKNITSSRWLQLLAFSLLAIVVVFGGYFFIYVEGRSHDLNEYYLRRLSETSANVDLELKRLLENIENAQRSAEDAFISEVNNERGLANPVLSDSATVQNAFSAWRKDLADALAMIPSIDTTANKFVQRLSPSAISVPTTEVSKLAVSGDLKKGNQDFGFGAEVWYSLKDSLYATYHFHANVPSLLSELLPVADFDQVFIAHDDGEVILRGRDSNLNLSRLNLAAHRNEAAANSKDGEDQYSVGHPSIFDAVIAGNEYRLFTQIIRVPPRINANLPEERVDPHALEHGSGSVEPWVLVGMKHKSSYNAEARSIPSTIILAAITLIVITLLALPFLKVHFIGARERLNRHDVLVLILSLLVGSSILAFVTMEIFAYDQSKEAVDEQLMSLHSQVETAFLGEINTVYAQLAAFAEIASAASNSSNYGPSIERFLSSAEETLQDSNVLLNEDVLDAALAYPFFGVAGFIDGKGVQLAKWTTAPRVTPRIIVADRAYFSQARDFGLWPRSDESDSSQIFDSNLLLKGRYIEAIRSRNTGKCFAVVSRRFRAPTSSARDSAVVITSGVELLSVINPILPPDFGFAIVNKAGTVLFHSEESRNLRENFLEEIDAKLQIESLLQARTSTQANIVYRTKEYRLYSKPLVSTPWTLIVLSARKPGRTIRIEILSFGFLIYSIYLLVLSLAFFGNYFSANRFQTYGPTALMWWIWPDPRKFDRYILILMANVVLAIVWLVSMVYWEPVEGILLAALLAFLSMASCISALILDKDDPTKLLNEDHRIELGLMGLLTIIIVYCGHGYPSQSLILLALAGFACGTVTLWRVVGSLEHRSITLYMSRMHLIVTWLIMCFACYFIGYCLASGLLLFAFLTAIVPITLGALAVLIGKKSFREKAHTLLQFADLALPSNDTERRQKWSNLVYTTGSVTLILLVGILPAITFYRAVHDEIVELDLKREQLELTNTVRARADRHVKSFSRLGVSERARNAFDAAIFPDSLSKAWDIHISGKTCHIHFENDSTHSDGTASKQSIIAELSKLLPDFAPLSLNIRAYTNSINADSKWEWRWHEHPSHSSDKARHSDTILCPDTTSKHLTLRYEKYQHNTLGEEQNQPGELTDPKNILIESSLHHFRFSKPWHWLIVATVLLLGFWFLVKLAIYRLYLAEMPAPKLLAPDDNADKVKGLESERAADSLAQHRFLLRVKINASEREAARVIEARRELIARMSMLQLQRDMKSFSGEKIIVTNFEDGLWEPAIAEKKLRLLELLVALSAQREEENRRQKNKKGRRSLSIDVYSEINPHYYFRLNDATVDTEKKEPVPGKKESEKSRTSEEMDLRRWAAVLSNFKRQRDMTLPKSYKRQHRKYIKALNELRDKAVTHKTREEEKLLHYLGTECWVHPELQKIGRRIASNADLKMLDSQTYIMHQVYDLAEDQYHKLWALSSKDEKMVLYRLCQEGLVSWQSRDLVRRLIHRGLILACPDFRPMNESFKRFVLIAEPMHVYEEWEKEAGPSIWAKLRIPFAIVILGLLVFFFGTQRELLHETLSISAAAAAAIPALMKLVGLLLQGRTKGEAS